MKTRLCPEHRVPLDEGGLCPLCTPARQNDIPTRRPPGQQPSDRASGSYEPVPHRKSSLSQLQQVQPEDIDPGTLETPQAAHPRVQTPTSPSGAYRLFESGGASTDGESSARFARGLPEDVFTEPLLIDESSRPDNRPPRRVQSIGGPPPISDESSPPPEVRDTDADVDEGCATDPTGSPFEMSSQLDEVLEEKTPVEQPQGLASYREELLQSQRTGAPPPKRPVSGTQLKKGPGSDDSGTGTS